MFNFARKHHTVFQSTYSILHAHKKCAWFPVSPDSLQHLCFSVFSRNCFFFFKSVLLSLSFFSRKHLKTKQNKHFCTKIGSGFTLFSLITHTLVNIGFKTFSESSLDTWKLKGQKKIELHGGNRKSRESSK